MVKLLVAAELELARGDIEAGLAAYLDAITRLRGMRFAGVETNGFEPWNVVAVATALAAHVRFGTTPAHRRQARELAEQARWLVEGLMTGPEGAIDYPVVGMTMASLGAWLLAGEPDPAAAESGVRLLSLAQHFSYSRWFPVMSWEAFGQIAETAAPGRLDAVSLEYGDRLGRELRDDAARVISRVSVTSSG